MSKRIRLYWDDESGVTPGWFGELQSRDQDGEWSVITDTMKVGEPDLDGYGEGERVEALAVLVEAWCDEATEETR